jgi:hypothetical protein
MGVSVDDKIGLSPSRAIGSSNQSMEEPKTETGEWIDKEPRTDGKPRRWKPGEVLTINLSRLIKQAQEDMPAHLSEDIHSRGRKST